MPTFPRGELSQLPPRFVSYRDRVAVAQAAAESDTPHVHRSSYEFPNPGDLRGIPAIGSGVQGHIAGTQPERRACR